jgi:nicotinate-nucleotide adenylyltransferase
MIGVLGGTFDPVHLGHLSAARQLLEKAGLEEVWLMPNAHPPYRREEPTAPALVRLNMLELAVAGMPQLKVSDLEVRRGGPSYTIDTIEELARTYPGRLFAWLLGSDQAREIRGWHRSDDLLATGHFIVFNRPAADLSSAELFKLGFNPARTSHVPIEPLPISAHDVRQRLASGLPVEDLLPPAVAEYIQAHGLYRPQNRVG